MIRAHRWASMMDSKSPSQSREKFIQIIQENIFNTCIGIVSRNKTYSPEHKYLIVNYDLLKDALDAARDKSRRETDTFLEDREHQDKAQKDLDGEEAEWKRDEEEIRNEEDMQEEINKACGDQIDLDEEVDKALKTITHERGNQNWWEGSRSGYNMEGGE